MERETKISRCFVGILILIAFTIGFWVGRSTVKNPEPIVKETTRWEKEPYAVHDTIYKPVPQRIEIPVDRPVFIPADTARLFEIWCDYYLKRDYELDYSNDTLGTFLVNVSIQENKLLSATSTVQPNRKIVEREKITYKSPKLQFWGMIGTSADFQNNKIQFGVDVKNKVLFGISGMRLDDKYGYTIDFGIKF